MSETAKAADWKRIETAPHHGRFLVTDGTQVGIAEGMGETGMMVKFLGETGQQLTGWMDMPPLPKAAMN